MGDFPGDRPGGDLIRERGHDERSAVLDLYDLDRGPGFDRTSAFSVGRLNADPAENLATRGEVRAFDVFHQVVDCGVWVSQQVDYRIAYFVEVVRRDIGGHSDCNALTSVYQQVGEAGRENLWFAEIA